MRIIYRVVDNYPMHKFRGNRKSSEYQMNAALLGICEVAGKFSISPGIQLNFLRSSAPIPLGINHEVLSHQVSFRLCIIYLTKWVI